MNHSLEKLNQQKVLDLLNSIWTGEHRFNELHEDLDWSKATVSKYLQSLKENDVIEKSLTPSDNVGYYFTEEGRAFFENQNLSESFKFSLDKDSLIEHQHKRNDLVDLLNQKGLFSDGLENQDIKEIILEFEEEFSREFDEEQELTAWWMRSFFMFLTRMCEPLVWDKKVDASLKIELNDPEDIKSDIEELKSSIEDIGWPD